MKATPEDSSTSPQPARSRLRRFGPALVILVILVMGYAVVRTARAGLAGQRGQAALTSAEASLNTRQLTEASVDLSRAVGHFRTMQHELDSLGPLLPVARSIPFLRVQVRGVESFARVGELLGEGGLDVIVAARAVTEPEDQDRPIAAALDALREVHRAVADGLTTLDAAVAEVEELQGYRLIGPLDTARDELLVHLPRTQARAASAEQGLSAFLAFAGDSGPRRYLIFSQNPDEIRPTGGYIGTYGVLRADEGGIELERYASIESWYMAHLDAQVPVEEAPTALQIADVPQSMANVGAIADWPTASRLAMELWQRGGEEPVDGVVSITPDLLARLLPVLGPVYLPSYEETVTESNLVELSDYYTHLELYEGVTRPGGPKQFVVELAEVVVQRLLELPASSWEPLGVAMAQGFDAREAMAWSTDAKVNEALAARRWDGVLPVMSGDFHYQGEYAFASKNSRGIRRAYTHEVELRPDGSGLVTTAVTMANTEPPGLYNPSSLSYITVYGPTGAHLVPPTDADGGIEDGLRGHPAAGWVRAAEPLGSTDLTVAWEVPDLLHRRADGKWEYRLWFMGAPGHSGDTLNLKIALPEGWSWQGPSPPEQASLDEDVMGIWILQAPSAP